MQRAVLVTFVGLQRQIGTSQQQKIDHVPPHGIFCMGHAALKKSEEHFDGLWMHLRMCVMECSFCDPPQCLVLIFQQLVESLSSCKQSQMMLATWHIVHQGHGSADGGASFSFRWMESPNGPFGLVVPSKKIKIKKAMEGKCTRGADFTPSRSKEFITHVTRGSSVP